MVLATSPTVEAGRRLFTVKEFEQMMASGILTSDERVELVDGEILALSPIGPRHAGSDAQVDDVLHERLGRRVTIFNQSPIVLLDPSTGVAVHRPQPDLAVLKRRADYYRGALPTAADVYFLVEIADSSVADDTTRKIPSYARGGIPEVWHLVLAADRLDDEVRVFSEPSFEGYRTVRVVRRGDTLTPRAFPDVSFAVTDLLG